MTKIILKLGIKKRVENGHPWVFKNEIETIEGQYQNGDIVSVHNHKDKFIGKGYINDNSLIIVRIMTRNSDEEINEDWIYQKIKAAYDYRKLITDTSACRVVFGEADFLPGLIVDKFNDYLSIQTLTLGIDQYKDIIVKALIDIIEPKGIYERNDNSVRLLEGLDERKGIIYGEFDPITIIEEYGVKVQVDIENGQKTGAFLDQKDNHHSIKSIVKDKTVLDCFTHTGGFALHAAIHGAKHVTAVDISETALENAYENAKLNQVDDQIDFLIGNVFDLLKDYTDEHKQFDVVILDPPAFTKSAKKIKSAYRGYKEINLRGMKLVKRGGFLVTASCSHYMTEPLFREMLQEAARDAKKTIREVEFKTQAKDHPILWGYDESYYLKFFILQVY